MSSIDTLAGMFPKEFLFGVATAAFQIEGAAFEDGRKSSIWDAFCRMPGRVYQGHTGDVACDHYHRWESDLDLIKSLGVDAYRFSIAWPRILPDGRGAVNEKGLDFYDRLIDGLVERGLKVFPTLYHWDLPHALAADGGWTARSTADAFANYTDVVVRRLGDRIDALATLNEPWCSAHLGHLWGIHAPGERSPEAFAAALHTLNLAHGRAVEAIRAVNPAIPVGLVLNLHSVFPASNTPEDAATAEQAFTFHNGVFLSPVFKGEYDADFLNAYRDRMDIRDGDLATISQPLDWWGLNYYTPMRVKHDPKPETLYPHAAIVPPSADVARTDIGWEIDETALADLIRKVYARYDLPPIYITENGACFNNEPVGGIVEDRDRIAYLEKHLQVTAEAATKDGIPMKGYFLWSLLDNFEWAEGYKMRFGIVHVDYDTQVRTVKNSGIWYRDLVRAYKTGL